MDTDLGCCFCTFADLGPTHVKEVLDMNNITSDESCMVNWSCLFKRIDHASKFFWVTNFQGLDKFFKRVEISGRKWLMDKIKNDQPGPGEKKRQTDFADCRFTTRSERISRKTWRNEDSL